MTDPRDRLTARQRITFAFWIANGVTVVALLLYALR